MECVLYKVKGHVHTSLASRPGPLTFDMGLMEYEASPVLVSVKAYAVSYEAEKSYKNSLQAVLWLSSKQSGHLFRTLSGQDHCKTAVCMTHY